MLDDARVVARRKPGGAGAPGELEQLREAEAPVAARARIRRLAAGVALDERLHDRPAESLPRVQGDVRNAERMTGLARGDHGLGRAAGALRVGRLRVDPEPERHADRGRPCPQERDRAVHAAAHRDRDPGRIGLGLEDRTDRVRERVDGEPLAADGGSLEQRQADERPLETVGVGLDDPVAVDDEAHAGPLVAARRVSGDLEHRVRLARAHSRGSTPLGAPHLRAEKKAPPCR